MDRLDKLPKWAQDEIKRLARDLNVANDTIASFDAKDSVITWRQGLQDKHGLPKHAVVDFHIGGNIITASLSKDVLRVSSSSSSISVLPSASNSVYVKCDE